MNLNTGCACLVGLDKPTGVLRAHTKCRHHVQTLLKEMRSEEAHYQRLGAIDHPEVYKTEFEECFGPMVKGEGKLLEIGPGTSPYLPMIYDAGYQYVAIEPSPYAVKWLRQKASGQAIIECDWEEYPLGGDQYPVILAAHCIEHMKHAPLAVKKMAEALKPGGTLYIIVPNDDDLCNPDHWWFFNTDSLDRTVKAAGLKVEVMEMRRRVKHEQFIYCKAVKP